MSRRQGQRLWGLLPQMSNEIIRLCCHAISLDRIFEGYVSSSKEDLQGCILCCHAWKDHYLQAVQMHTEYDMPPVTPHISTPLSSL